MKPKFWTLLVCMSAIAVLLPKGALAQTVRAESGNTLATTTTTPEPSSEPTTPEANSAPTSPASNQTLLQEEGTLEPGDTVLPSDNSLFDRFTFQGEAGQQITISLESTEFDTYLVLVDPNGASLEQNDDISPADRNSRISIELPTAGTYTILANGFDSNSRGQYTLTVTSP